MTYASDDVVQTGDGKRHRVIYQSGEQLFVKSLDCKNRKAHKIDARKVVKHEPRKPR